mmetsp:Transcript_13150/g.35803  ORF Transcript_13150/g.35803 Transcript_13150/m.35803 type:complete len:88 (-) Transcript_13150:51-314(-)
MRLHQTRGSVCKMRLFELMGFHYSLLMWMVHSLASLSGVCCACWPLHECRSFYTLQVHASRNGEPCQAARHKCFAMSQATELISVRG